MLHSDGGLEQEMCCPIDYLFSAELEALIPFGVSSFFNASFAAALHVVN